MAGRNVGADYALVDPDLMDNLPARVTAACAVTLPYVIDFNYSCAAEGYDMLADTLASGSNKSLSAIVYDLEREVGIPTLKECGIPEDKLQFLADETMKEDFGPNPNQDITPETVLNILKKAYAGQI